MSTIVAVQPEKRPRINKHRWDYTSTPVDLVETANILGILPLSPVPEQDQERLLAENLSSGHKFEIGNAFEMLPWIDVFGKLFSALTMNKTVRKIKLQDGHWPKEVWLGLCGVLMTNKSIVKVRYEGNSMFAEGSVALGIFFFSFILVFFLFLFFALVFSCFFFCVSRNPFCFISF